MASAQQLIGLVKSHAEGDETRFFDLAMQLAAAEEQKGHKRLAEQLRQWAAAGISPQSKSKTAPTPLVSPRGDLVGLLGAAYPSVRLNDLVLPAAIQEELATIVVEKHHSERLEEKGLKPRRRLLLAGPPGTGKTMSAAALAGELHYPLFSVLLHGLITKFMGETAQKLRLIFDAVRTNRGVYLFDEIDALAATRSNENDIGEARRILNSFLQFLDEDTGPSIIVATTNLPGLLDRAILRRFDLVLPYQLPSGKDIETVMVRRLREFDVKGVRWPEVARIAGGLSTADVVSAGEDAARRAVLRDSVQIETSALVDALLRRRALQRVGAGIDGEGQAALSTTKPRKGAGIQAKGRRIKKTPG